MGTRSYCLSPQDSSQRLRALHREIWEGVEPQEYVRQEREAWQT